jgi:hypothetical protein
LSYDHFPEQDFGKVREAALHLELLHRDWLYPHEMLNELHQGFHPQAPVLTPRDETATVELSRRTLTRLYKEFPEQLREAHHSLDEAVGNLYGISLSHNADEIFNILLDLHIAQNIGEN